MPTAKKDALIAEIVDNCARNGRPGAVPVTAAPAPYRSLFSACPVGAAILSNRCVIAPKAMIGGSFIPNGKRRRFYRERANAGLLTTGPLSTGKESDPLSVARWRPLNEKLHAKGARILLQLLPDGTAQHALHLTLAGAAAGFDGVCFDICTDDANAIPLVREIRARLGKGFLILCRVSLSSAVAESGLSAKNDQEARGLAERLERMTELANAGCDAFEVGLGCEQTPWLLAPASQLPEGCFAEAARALKSHFRVLGIGAAVIAAGRLADPGLAEALLRDGYCDLVSLDGAGISDPEWIRKSADGRSDEIQPTSLPAFSLPQEKERIAVIGAGCRGLSYAVQAADAGHAVDLFEQNYCPGGDLALDPSPAAEEKKKLLSYLLSELKKRPQIRLRTGTKADAELLKKGAYDRIVFACRPEALVRPSVPNWGTLPITTAEELEKAQNGKWKRNHVVVLGSNALACDIAWMLLNDGLVRRCTILTEKQALMSGEPDEDRAWFLHHFAQRGGRVMTGQRASRIFRHTIFSEDPNGGAESHVHCDQIVLTEKAPAQMRLYEEAVREKLAPQIQIL